MRKAYLLPLALVALVGAGAGGTAWAAGNDEDREATALQGLPTTLSQAIATAEQQTGGKAFDAGVNVRDNAVHIEVGTNGPKGIQTVEVDARNGQVVGTRAGTEKD